MAIIADFSDRDLSRTYYSNQQLASLKFDSTKPYEAEPKRIPKYLEKTWIAKYLW